MLLLGDASIDPRNFLGAGDNDLVPTKQIDVDPLQTASDDWFADFGERGVAELAIGRIPARTLAEAQAIIDKLVRHERTWTGEQNGALMVSDSPTMLDDFEEITREVAGVLPGWLPVDLRVRGKDAFTDPAGLVAAMNAGPLLVNYVGSWVDQPVARAAGHRQVAKLTNRDRPSLVVAMTCLNGLFQDPRNTTMAEALLGAPEGGAFAVWTSSGFNPVAGQSQLDQAFLRAALARPAAAGRGRPGGQGRRRELRRQPHLDPVRRSQPLAAVEHGPAPVRVGIEHGRLLRGGDPRVRWRAGLRRPGRTDAAGNLAGPPAPPWAPVLITARRQPRPGHPSGTRPSSR